MVNWWFGILGISRSNNSFHKGVLGIQTTNPNPPMINHSLILEPPLLQVWLYVHVILVLGCFQKVHLSPGKSTMNMILLPQKDVHILNLQSQKIVFLRRKILWTNSYNYFTKEGTCAPPSVSTHKGEFSSNARYIKCCKNLGIQLALAGQGYLCFFCLIFILLNPVEGLPKNKILLFFCGCSTVLSDRR